jgi:hypothetical protein
MPFLTVCTADGSGTGSPSKTVAARRPARLSSLVYGAACPASSEEPRFGLWSVQPPRHETDAIRGPPFGGCRGLDRRPAWNRALTPLASIRVAGPDIIILDDPATGLTGLSAREVDHLACVLSSLKPQAVIIEHQPGFYFRCVIK